MSDAGRQSISSKIESTIKPDSEKSTFEQVKDATAGKADNAAGKAQSDEDKSILQQASDAVFGK